MGDRSEPTGVGAGPTAGRLLRPGPVTAPRPGHDRSGAGPRPARGLPRSAVSPRTGSHDTSAGRGAARLLLRPGLGHRAERQSPSLPAGSAFPPAGSLSVSARPATGGSFHGSGAGTGH